MAFKYAIALTGSIATGKSTVAAYFSSCGFTIIDADSIAHTILNQQYKVISHMFGKEVLEGKKVNRKILGAIVFSDSEKRKQLETLLHPLIYNEIERLSEIEDKKEKPYFIDIPLFFEYKRYPIEKSLVVYTTKEEQLKRVIKRDGYNAKEAYARINTQIPVEKKREQATYVIDNTKDITALQSECERVKEEIVGAFR